MTAARDLLRADVLHPPLRGDAPRPLLAREARRHDAHVHRAGGERGRAHRPPRSRRRHDLLQPPLPRALPRVHRRRVRPALRGDGEGAGRVRRQGRQPAPVQGQLLLERRAREHRPGGDGDRARGEAERHGRGLDRVPRRRHARRGRDLRVAQHRLALAAAGALRRREQPLRAVDAGRARARRVDRGARSRLRGRGRTSSTRPTWSRSTRRRAARSRAFARRARRSSSSSTRTASARTRSRTTSATRPRSRSGARAIRCSSPARASPRTSASAIEARCEERLAETVEAADAAPAATPGVAA